MTPQERAEFNRMKKDLEALKMCKDVVFVENLKLRGIGNTTVTDGADATGTTNTVGSVDNLSSVTVAEEYTGVLTLTDQDGNTYRIGYYS